MGVFLIMLSIHIKAEGTKEIQPTQASYGRLQLMPHVTNFAIFGASPEHRLHITICQPGEKIYYGFGYVREYYGSIQYDIIYRIKDPNGNIVVGPTSIPYSGAGFIQNYTQASNGPNIINSSGYNPLLYTPTMLGDYYIEFSFTQPYGSERKVFDFIDITVVSANNQAKPGRLWSKNWQLTTDPQAPFLTPYHAGYDGKIYIYADDGIVTSVDLNNMQPFVFNITANKTGCFNTGNLIQDRKSSTGNNTYPQYRIFLNNPDSICFPSGHFGGFTAPTTVTGCPGDFCINVYVNMPGNIEVLLNLNGISGYQPNSADLLFVFNAVTGHNCIPWDGLDGLGNIIASGTSLPIEVNYYNGLTHLPLFDVEANNSGFKVEIVRPYTPNPIPLMYWDDTGIGGGMQLVGCNNPNGCHTWPIGTCYQNPVPNYCSLGDMRTINTWWHANSIKDTASVFLEYPIANANALTPVGQNDTTICYENNSLQLNGAVQLATSGIWEGSGGTFAPSNTLLNASYTFSQSELNAGYAILVLNTQGGSCANISDTMRITIIKAVAHTMPDTSMCEGQSATLSAWGGTSYLWSPAVSLNNSNIPNPVASPTVNTTYTVTITDINGCTASNSMVVLMKDAPAIDFIPDVTSGCKPLVVNFQSITAAHIAQYNWNFGDNNSGPYNTSSAAHPAHIYNNSGIFTVSLTVTSTDGCVGTVTYPQLIHVFPHPIASFYTNPPEGDSDNMLFYFINESTNSIEWNWDFGDINAGINNYSNMQYPQHEYSQEGVYTVWLWVSSIDGCKDSTSRDIIIREQASFYVPNAFTPDGDGKNDFFIPSGIGVDNNNFHMYIFNRWGELIFYTEDIHYPWYGKVKNTGNDAPQDVYVWLIYTENNIIGRKKYVGHVTLIR